MPRGVYKRNGRKGQVIPLDAIPERTVRAVAVRSHGRMEAAKLQLAAEVVRLLQSIIGGAR
jgi:hypothetical protein